MAGVIEAGCGGGGGGAGALLSLVGGDSAGPVSGKEGKDLTNDAEF